MVVVHFIDVGQGNMTLVEMPNGTIFLYDCNVTDENADRVLKYLGTALGGRAIAFFVNSHREADHMRGLKRLTKAFPIKEICDNGLPGGTTASREYNEYMEVRRNATQFTVAGGQVWDCGTGRVRVLNAANSLLASDPNAQSIVLKIENLHPVTGAIVNSVMLTGDSDAATWHDWIVPVHRQHLRSSILLGGHHGAATFVTKPDGTRYTAHLSAISPEMTIVSVGDNTYGHPEAVALQAYTGASAGDSQGVKVLRTDLKGTIKFILPVVGPWTWSATGPSPKVPPPPRLQSLAHILASPMKEQSPVFPPPRLQSLADILAIPKEQAPVYPPPVNSLANIGDIVAALVKATPPKKTPFEEYIEWLAKQPPQK